MAVAHINRIGTAVPPHDVHQAFMTLVDSFLTDRRQQVLLKRMAGRSGIEHRYSFFEPDPSCHFTADKERFYAPEGFPTTGARMQRFAKSAPGLAADAIADLDLGDGLAGITHLVVASCTGFTAPGLDQEIVRRVGLDPGIERTVVGFMGCYAAVNSLRLAHHFVRSDPAARVLVVNLELCTLHFQKTAELDRLLSMLLFGDGASAALVTADPVGLALQDFKAISIPESDGLITWGIGDQGFDMHLSGDVPQRINRALTAERQRNDDGGIMRGRRPEDFDLFAVHAGGRTILDAVEQSLELAAHALAPSRTILREFGNMSSATLMFVLQRIMREATAAADGLGMAFGPGLACESFRFRTV